MDTKLLVLLLCAIFNLQKVESRCWRILTKAEMHCAHYFDFKPNSIFELYRSDSNDSKFEEYLHCVWLRWNYIDSNGLILYDNLKKSTSLSWQVARICHNNLNYHDQMINDFQEAAEYCKENPPDVENPKTVSKCIIENYKPTPVSFGVTYLN